MKIMFKHLKLSHCSLPLGLKEMLLLQRESAKPNYLNTIWSEKNIAAAIFFQGLLAFLSKGDSLETLPIFSLLRNILAVNGHFFF